MEMAAVYLVCAAIGGTLVVCQFLLTLLGLGGGDHDIAAHDVGGHDIHVGQGDVGHHEAGHGAESSWFFSILSFRALSAAIGFFGLAGLAASQSAIEPIPTLALALGAGVVALFLVAWVMNLLTKLNVDGTVRIERSIGARGTVYLAVPGQKEGAGKVHISQHNRLMEYNAVTSQAPLPTGSKIVVVGVVNPDTVEVTSLTESERVIHA